MPVAPVTNIRYAPILVQFLRKWSAVKTQEGIGQKHERLLSSCRQKTKDKNENTYQVLILFCKTQKQRETQQQRQLG